MKIELEADDIQMITDSVVNKLQPVLLRLQEVAQLHSSQPTVLPSTIATKSGSAMIGSSEVKRLTGLSATTVWRLEKAGTFPPRVLLSSNRVGWVRQEIEEWLNSRQRYKKGKLQN